MKKLLPLFLLVPFLGLAQLPQPYYDDVNLTLEGMALMEELSEKITVTHTNELSYTPGIWEASKETDEDPNNPNNVLLIYGYNDTDGNYINDRSRDKDLNGGDPGTEWNREHVYAKSLGTPSFDNEGPGADAHHLRPSDVTMNGNRGNRKFTDGSGNAGTVGSFWYPGDEWKGDVARMMMYMYLRYGSRALPTNVADGTANDIDPNMVNLLLEWNAEDPVSIIEDQRNTYHDNEETEETYAQGNRNPFIDNPFLATRIWGGPVAEDRWEISDDDQAPTAPTNLTASNITATTVDLSWDAATDNEAVSSYSIYVDAEFYTSTSATTIILSELSSNTTYNIVVYANDAAGNTSTASNSVEITTLDGPDYIIFEDFNNCSTVADNFVPYSQTSSYNWECQDQYGADNTGSYGINAFDGGGTVQSIDWLITTNSFDLNATDDELLSFYTDASFGDTELELLYSTNYDGSGNAENFTWTPVPGADIPTHSGSGEEEVFAFENVDISSISGTVYFAFRYDTNGGDATRWTVDNFQIVSGGAMAVNSNDKLDFKLFPNPSTGEINILLDPSQKIELKLYDITGRLIISKVKNSTDGSIQLNNVPNGFYLLNISSEGKTATQKIVVE